MVKFKLYVSRSGADGAFSAGDVIEVGPEEASRMAMAGQGEIVRENKPERAVRKPRAEKATK